MNGFGLLLLTIAIDPTSGMSAATPPAPETGHAVAADVAAPQPDSPEAKKPATPEHTGIHALIAGVKEDFKNLPSVPNLYIALIGGAGAVAVHPLDDDVNAKLRGHQNTAVPVFAAGKWIGQTEVQVATALAAYAYGRVEDEPKVSHLGMDLIRAQILTGILTTGLKYATNRERPDQSNHQSFPSGHASVTFASATVIERHLGWKYSALGYAIASYVAASRLHDNRHYLSDVVFGAAVGTIGGRTVTQHGANNWTFAPASIPGGVMVVVARTGEPATR